MQPTHVVIVGLDGLRADMMTPTPRRICCVSPSRASGAHGITPCSRRQRGSMSQVWLRAPTRARMGSPTARSLSLVCLRIRRSISASTRWSRLPTRFMEGHCGDPEPGKNPHDPWRDHGGGEPAPRAQTASCTKVKALEDSLPTQGTRPAILSLGETTQKFGPVPAAGKLTRRAWRILRRSS
jgi:hypothetical protein